MGIRHNTENDTAVLDIWHSIDKWMDYTFITVYSVSVHVMGPYIYPFITVCVVCQGIWWAPISTLSLLYN